MVYVLYTSNVRSEETAMSSALVELVTAMKSSNNISPAPPFPSNAMAVAGELNSAPFCAAESGLGYVGKEGADVRAAHPRPMAVAKPNGIPYNAIPPKMYALTEVLGRKAMARCQYAWSSQTVEKPATKKSMAKTNPSSDLKVRYEPSWLWGIGERADASTRRS